MYRRSTVLSNQHEAYKLELLKCERIHILYIIIREQYHKKEASK